MSIIKYLKDTKAEMSHVTWPTKKQTIAYTLAVIVISILVAYFLGAFDFIFSQGIKAIIGF
jgi:preprotein translocase subunit SecE